MFREFIFLDILSAIVCFFLGYYVFLKDPKRTINRLFFILSSAISLIAISSAGMKFVGFRPGLSPREAIELVPREKIDLLFLLNAIGWLGVAFVPSLLLHLVLIVVKEKVKKKYLLLLYFPSFIFFIWTLFYYRPPQPKNIFHSLLYFFFSIYFIFVCLFSLFLLFEKYFSSKSLQVRKKIVYFILGFSIPVFGTIISDVLIPMVKFQEFVGTIYSLYFVTLGYFFLALGVLRHGLFIDYRQILETIFRSLTELVFIVDREGFILLTNEITLAKLGHKEIVGKKIEEILKRGEEKWREILNKLKESGTIPEERVSFLGKEREEIPFLLSISQTKEGIILVGRDIKELVEYQKKLEREVKKKTEELEEAKKVLEIKVAARTRELRELAQSLEEKIKERTRELRERVEELEKFQRLAIGRELRMVELKKEIERLKKQLKK